MKDLLYCSFQFGRSKVVRPPCKLLQLKTESQILSVNL